MRNHLSIKLILAGLAGLLVVGLGPPNPVRAASLPLACSTLRAQIYDGVPGPGVLLGPSSGGCPSLATASHSNFEAESLAQVSLSPVLLSHQHTVDITASSVTRITITEAFISLTLPTGASNFDLLPVFSVDPLRFSSVLQLEDMSAGTRLTLVSGSPLLPGESTVWADSDGAISASTLTFDPGASIRIYSRLASYNDVNNIYSLTFSAVPEPTTGLLLTGGVLVLSMRRGPCKRKV